MQFKGFFLFALIAVFATMFVSSRGEGYPNRECTDGHGCQDNECCVNEFCKSGDECKCGVYPCDKDQMCKTTIEVKGNVDLHFQNCIYYQHLDKNHQ